MQMTYQAVHARERMVRKFGSYFSSSEMLRSGSVRRFGSYGSVARQPMYGTKYRVRGNQPGRRQPRHSDPTIHFGGAGYILVAACRRRPVSAFARCRAMLDCVRSSRRRRHLTPLHLHSPSITSKPTSIGAFVAFYQTDNALRKWKCGLKAEYGNYA